MKLYDFCKMYLLLPIAVFLQILGYHEAINQKLELPYPFLIPTSIFIMLTSCLIWFVWFAKQTATGNQKKFALVCIIVFSMSYYTFIQYTIINSINTSMAKTIIAIENTRGVKDPKYIIEKIGNLNLKINELIAVTNNILGQAYYKSGNFEDAIKSYELASLSDPNNTEYLFNIAVTSREICDFDTAKTLIDAYVKKESYTSGRYERAVIYHLSGKYDDLEEALKEYNIIIGGGGDKKEKETAAFNSATVYALKYEITHDNRFVKKAIEYLDRSIDIGRKERIKKIKKSLNIDPSSYRCDGLGRSDYLISLIEHDSFKTWLRKHKISIGEMKSS